MFFFSRSGKKNFPKQFTEEIRYKNYHTKFFPFIPKAEGGIKDRIIYLRVPAPSEKEIHSVRDSKFYAIMGKICFFSIDTHQAQKEFRFFSFCFTF